MNYKKSIVFASILSLTIPAVSYAADGAAIYKAKCESCHGADGGGMTPMGKAMKLRDLSSAAVQKQSDAELTKVTADGKGKMPAYKTKMTDAEIAAVVAHIRSMKK